jgi:hypothetical protein
VAKVGTSEAGGTISQQAAVHPWLAADAQRNKQTNCANNYGGSRGDTIIELQGATVSHSSKDEVPVFWDMALSALFVLP